MSGDGTLASEHMLSSSSRLTTPPGAGSNMRIAVGVLIGSLLIAGALLARAAGAHTTHPCPCRYPGGVAPPGAVICLEVNGKRSLARCEIVLNNPSLHILPEPCRIASLTKPASAPGPRSILYTGSSSPRAMAP